MYKFVQWSFSRFVIFNSSYTTGFSFILVPTWLLISVSVYNTFDFLPFTKISAAPVSATVSVTKVHSAWMHAKFLFPDKGSCTLIVNARVCDH